MIIKFGLFLNIAYAFRHDTCTQMVHSLVTLFGTHVTCDKLGFQKISKPVINIISVLNSNLFCKRAILINRNYILEIPVSYKK